MKTLISIALAAILAAVCSVGLMTVAEAHGAAGVATPAAAPADGPYRPLYVLAVTDPSPAAAPGRVSLPDPVEDPGGFWSALLAAKKYGWPVLIMALVATLATVLRSRIAWLNQEGTRRAAGLAGLSGVALAVGDALAGGSWGPVAIAAGMAIAWLLDPRSRPRVAADKAGGAA